MESELFGYESGAFTGALKEGKAGLFEQANKGTVFLDEVGDMPLPLQARLLRVIQERQVTRIGSPKVLNVDIRIIAATNKDLSEACRMGRFREDLYYRLNVLPLALPALREHKEDILLLLAYFTDGEKGITLTDEVKEMLLRYNWPGNIREVQNIASYINFVIEGEVSIEKLPRYLLSSINDFKKEYDLLRAKLDIVKVITLLQILSRAHQSGSGGMGRKYLEEASASEGVFMSEGEIRGALQMLNQIGFIVSKTGRTGSAITPTGLLFLCWEKANRQIDVTCLSR